MPLRFSRARLEGIASGEIWLPNFVRGAVVLITTSFVSLKGPMGLLGAAWVVGIACFVLAAASLAGLEETHGRDLDFVE